MKLEKVISTTHVDRQGMRMSKDALDSMADQINSGRKSAFTVEHDRTLPPLGKILEARVELMEDGEYGLIAVSEIYEDPEDIELPDGTPALRQRSQYNQSPFFAPIEASKGVVLSIDPFSFESNSHLESFLEEVRSASQLDFTEHTFFRKSWTPDPELIIRLSESLVSFLLAKKVIDKVGDKVADQIVDEMSNFYSFVRAAIIGMAKYAHPKNRPITYVFKVVSHPYIELFARSNNVDLILAAIQEDKLRDVLSKAEQYKVTLRAEQVQFLMSLEGEWKLNYLLTDTGEVIGTKESFARRARQLEITLLDNPDRNNVEEDKTEG